jgi:hypothetical protein
MCVRYPLPFSSRRSDLGWMLGFVQLVLQGFLSRLIQYDLPSTGTTKRVDPEAYFSLGYKDANALYIFSDKITVLLARNGQCSHSS